MQKSHEMQKSTQLVLTDLPQEILTHIWCFACENCDGSAWAFSQVCRATFEASKGEYPLRVMLRRLSPQQRQVYWERMAQRTNVLTQLPHMLSIIEAAAPLVQPCILTNKMSQYDRFDLVILSRGPSTLCDGISLLFRVLINLATLAKQITKETRQMVCTFVKTLLANGVDVHSAEEFSLQYCSANGFLDLVQIFYEFGANIHFNEDEALRWASARGHAEVVQWLIKHGANIHSKNNGALLAAAYFGQHQVVEILLQAGADIHALQDEALFQAVFGGSEETAMLLLTYGANPCHRLSQLVSCSLWHCQLNLVGLMLMMKATQWNLGLSQQQPTQIDRSSNQTIPQII